MVMIEWYWCKDKTIELGLNEITSDEQGLGARLREECSVEWGLALKGNDTHLRADSTELELTL